MQLIRAAVMKVLPVIIFAGVLASAGIAKADPPPRPLGWAGEDYYYHGQHYHHRAWAYDRHHRRYRRYY